LLRYEFLQRSHINDNQVAIPAGFDKLRPNMVWSPDKRWLAFDESTPSGNKDIYITDWPAQSKLIRVTNALGDDLYPSWSPDGNRITYENYYDKYIYILDLSCFLLNRVCDPHPSVVTKGSNPVWSPDGKYIAYEGYSELCDTCNRGKIFVIDLEMGESSRQMINPEGINCNWPRWAPYGTRLTINCARGIYIVNSDGTGLEQLITAGDMTEWSPDGKLIAFRGDKSLDSNLGKPVGMTGMDAELTSNALFTIRPDGTELRRMTLNNYQNVQIFFWIPYEPVSSH